MDLDTLKQEYGLDIEKLLEPYLFQLMSTQIGQSIKQDINKYLSQEIGESDEYVTNVTMDYNTNALNVDINPSGIIRQRIMERNRKIEDVLDIPLNERETPGVKPIEINMTIVKTGTIL